ncbi:MAG: glycosyltransferase, partial [Chlamydiia bacterium]|nr:glycosyltransferase [Chlamydiia bacterium]
METYHIKQHKPEGTTKSLLWQKLTGDEGKYQDYEYPKVSIVLPTYNCAQVIGLTLESILNQEYPDFEVIIVDGGSTDRTLEIVKNYREEKVRIFSVSGFQRYEMLNKGISQGTGAYFNFLFPGDYYIYRKTLKYLMGMALDYQSPHMVFCGTMLRGGKTDLKIMYRHLSASLLKKGHQPTSLQSCWLHADVFKKIGKFNTTLKLRGGFDLFCRFVLHHHLKTVSTTRVLTDYDLRLVTRPMIATHFWE